MTQVEKLNVYTEATHVVYAEVSGADAIDTSDGSRQMKPERITCKYYWRTQVDDNGWHFGAIELAGWRLPLEGEEKAPFDGRAVVILGEANAPNWAQEFAKAHWPTVTLVDQS